MKVFFVFRSNEEPDKDITNLLSVDSFIGVVDLYQTSLIHLLMFISEGQVL